MARDNYYLPSYRAGNLQKGLLGTWSENVNKTVTRATGRVQLAHQEAVLHHRAVGGSAQDLLNINGAAMAAAAELENARQAAVSSNPVAMRAAAGRAFKHAQNLHNTHKDLGGSPSQDALRSIVGLANVTGEAMAEKTTKMPPSGETRRKGAGQRELTPSQRERRIG